jgi:DNA polymerase I
MKNNFIIIDGNSVLHRGFHAMPPLTNKRGEPVGAVYGFMLALFKSIEDFEPKHIAVCFDTKAPTFRHEEFKDYKSQRPETPDTLIPQFATVRRLLADMGVKVFAEDGFEADDLIASVVAAGKKDPASEDTDFYVLTGDYDSLQLVGGNVKSFIITRGVKNAVMFDAAKVEEEFGVGPEQIPDYKALAGDASDNIPGAPGIGPKAAREILKKFKTLEDLYSAAAADPKNFSVTANGNGERLKKILLENREMVLQFKKLATMSPKGAVGRVFDNCRFDNFSGKKPKEALTELGLGSLAKRLPLGRASRNGTLF